MKKSQISNLKSQITIGYLYGDLMNIYGDTGNIIALKKRAEWRGIDVEIKQITIGTSLKKGDIDLFFFGGGQDQAQALVARDLSNSNKGKILKQEIERGVPLLAICGGYQLLGEYYQPHKGQKLPGVNIFPAYTIAGNRRMIGNIILEINDSRLTINDRNLKSSKTDRSQASLIINHQSLNLVGFENHSGETFLRDANLALGKVQKGFGNNGEDKTEGCVYKNAIGCYMHGSLLPKNPKLADWLLKTALEVKYEKEIELKPLDDLLEIEAHNTTISRFG